jgi:hypothetical protein
MGSQMAGSLVSVVGGPDSLLQHLTSCVPSSHQTSKAIQPLVLVGPVLLKLLHSVVAHCHLKQQICTQSVMLCNNVILLHPVVLCNLT